MKKDKVVTFRISSDILEAMLKDGITPSEIINKFIDDNYEVEVKTTVKRKNKTKLKVA